MPGRFLDLSIRLGLTSKQDGLAHPSHLPSNGDPKRELLEPNNLIVSQSEVYASFTGPERRRNERYAAKGTRPDFTIILSCVRRRMPSRIAVAPMILSCGSLG